MTREKILEKFDYLAKVGFCTKNEYNISSKDGGWYSYENLKNPIYNKPFIPVIVEIPTYKDTINIRNDDIRFICNFEEIEILKEFFTYKCANISLYYDLLIQLKNKTKFLLTFYR